MGSTIDSNQQEMTSSSLTSLLILRDEEEKDKESENEAQMLIDQMSEEAKGYCCAAEDQCGMNNSPFTDRDFHRCKTCHGRVHGIFCCVRQYEDEEGTGIYYCLKCGRPEDDRPKKVEVQSTYNLRTRKNQEEAATTLATLAKTSKALGKTSQTKTAETSAKIPEKRTPETSAKTPEKRAPENSAKIPEKRTLETSTTKIPGKYTESPKKSIKRPEKIAEMKGYNVARVFEVTARQVKKLQLSSTWEEDEDRQEKPSCQYALLSCDEMLSKPFTKERYKRKAGQEQITLQTYEGFDHKKWGGRIKQMGADMEKGKKSGKNWKIVESVLEHHQRIFGSTIKFRPYGGDKKQAETYNDLLGAGYEEEDGDKKLPAKKKIQRKRAKKS